MIQIPERILEEQKEFRERVEAYQKGEIEEVEFKARRSEGTVLLLPPIFL
ncbi:hypothetical protein [Alkaliphilus crotonatoxidans]